MIGLVDVSAASGPDEAASVAAGAGLDAPIVVGAVMADAVGMILVALMWALSLAALAGAAYLLGRWMRNREERRRRPADPAESRRPLSRSTRRSVKRGERRAENSSDLDGYL